ncbi:hypothetical protein AB0K00_29670 [Dactylosporangium sp. NPDC049525]|uniref:hypothetical protein n=1 Tax=Dactylosporangium sp. NPDC049525 TaxID=3154730 RepID=UPI00343485B2
MTRTLHRPGVIAGVLLGALGLADLGPFSPGGPVTWILPLAALGYLVAAHLRGEPAAGSARRPARRRQVAGVALFTAVALAALLLDPAIGQYVLAAGWVGHAAWDWAHRDGSVVPRWYVDFCLPLDLLVAASLVAAASIG